MALLLGARTLLGTKGIATRSKDEQRMVALLLGARTLIASKFAATKVKIQMLH